MLLFNALQELDMKTEDQSSLEELAEGGRLSGNLERLHVSTSRTWKTGRSRGTGRRSKNTVST